MFDFLLDFQGLYIKKTIIIFTFFCHAAHKDVQRKRIRCCGTVPEETPEYGMPDQNSGICFCFGRGVQNGMKGFREKVVSQNQACRFCVSSARYTFCPEICFPGLLTLSSACPSRHLRYFPYPDLS